MIETIVVVCPDCGKVKTVSRNSMMPIGATVILSSCIYCNGLTQHYELDFYDEKGNKL